MANGPQGAKYELSDEQIERIAEKAAERALEIVYAEVGKSVIRRISWIVGVCAIGFALWLAGKNALPISLKP